MEKKILVKNKYSHTFFNINALFQPTIRKTKKSVFQEFDSFFRNLQYTKLVRFRWKKTLQVGTNDALNVSVTFFKNNLMQVGP